MRIKRRDMKLSGFHDGSKKYFSKTITNGSLSGVISITKFFDVKEKSEVHYNFKDAIIVDNNYTWIQIAFKKQNFWIKAMYDQKDNLVEIYVDVSRKNTFDDITNPEYEDLFLDVVIPPKGHIYHMDDIELMKAKNEGIITEDDYKLCKTVCKKMEDYFEKNRQELLDYLWMMKQELEYELDHQDK